MTADEHKQKFPKYISPESVLEKHCPSMNNLYLGKQGREFMNRIVEAMNEFARMKWEQACDATKDKIGLALFNDEDADIDEVPNPEYR